jgi:hypothetical protein
MDLNAYRRLDAVQSCALTLGILVRVASGWSQMARSSHGSLPSGLVDRVEFNVIMDRSVTCVQRFWKSGTHSERRSASSLMQTWRNFVHLLILILSILASTHIGLGQDVLLEDLGGMLPAGDGTLDAPIDFTNADDVMEKLGPVVSSTVCIS